MIDLGWALQRAAYSKLRDDPDVKAVLGDPARIYDVPPTDAVYPFASFSEWRVAALKGVEAAFEHDVRIRVFSRYEGRKETRAAMAAIHGALHDAALAPTGRDLTSFRFVFSDVFPQADGRTWSGVMRFRAVDAPAAVPAS